MCSLVSIMRRFVNHIVCETLALVKTLRYSNPAAVATPLGIAFEGAFEGFVSERFAFI